MTIVTGLIEEEMDGRKIKYDCCSILQRRKILGSFLEREQNKWKLGSSVKGTCVRSLRYEGPGKWLSLQYSLFLVY